jgi:CubicO group peptidase (beta-lactamase class C family)
MENDIRYHQRSLNPVLRLIRSVGVAAIALAVLTRTPVHAEDLVYARLGDYLESLRQQLGIPGLAAAVVGRNGILWERKYGYQDIERALPMRGDTPMHVDGLTEMFTAALTLRCVEEGRLSLEDRIGQFRPSSPDANVTLRQALTHNVGSNGTPSFSYRPDRLAELAPAIRACTNDSYRETLANLMDSQAMINSVPGQDVVLLAPPAEGILTPAVERYREILGRLAVPYAVDSQKRATATQFTATALTSATGLISTMDDLAQFDTALRNGILLRPDTLAAAWRPAAGYPHGIGWFVQSYNGDSVVWQFGNSGTGSSSIWITVPSRAVTFLAVANSNGLAKGFSLSNGDVTQSPFARAFLGVFLP